MPDSRAKVPGDCRLFLAILYSGRLIQNVQVDIIETLQQWHTRFYLVRKTDLTNEVERRNYWNISYYSDILTGMSETYTIIATSDGYSSIETDARDAWKELERVEKSPSQEQLWDLGLS